MKFWPQCLRFLWEEEATPSPPVASATGPPGEITGVPGFLRKATRWSVTAVVGATLVGQIIGVRMIAPAAADEPHSSPNTQPCYIQSCTAGCSADLKECLLGNLGRPIDQCNKDFNSCVKGCIEGCLP
jgi:hypothetical protein